MSKDPRAYRFMPLGLAIATISDSRTIENDTSGAALFERAELAGHKLIERLIVSDNVHEIRAVLAPWIIDPKIQVIITTGGTGLTGRDVTPEAVTPLFDRHIEGFGELFRSLSFAEIGTATLQSRSFAGIANGTAIFCVPGSTGACRTAWDKIICHQIDGSTKPCNLAQIMPRMTER